MVKGNSARHTMKAENILIAWNDDERLRVTDCFITDDQDEWNRRGDEYDNSGGACHHDWMKPLEPGESPAEVNDSHRDPLGTFAMMSMQGFASKDALRQVLAEFAKVDDCDWARGMLAGLDRQPLSSNKAD